MSDESNGEITQLLRAWARNEPEAFEKLFPLVFEELRQLAGHHLRGRSPGHTLEPTALVHEAYLRLVQRQPSDFSSRRQFFAFASKVLRGILVDHARAKEARKRGGSDRDHSLDEARGVPADQGIEMEWVLSINNVLARLEALHKRQGRIVELRYFGGLTVPEIADALELSERTVERDWQAARRWMVRELNQPMAKD